MKKIVIVSAALVAALVILWVIPVTKSSSISISAPVIDISQQLSNAAKWKKWNPDLKIAAEKDSANYKAYQDYQNHSFTIITAQQTVQAKSFSGIHFEINIKKNGTASLYDIKLAAEKDVRSAVVITEEKTSLLSSIFLPTKNNTSQENIFKYLKAFMETDSLYYGFNISIQPVADTNVLSYKKHVPAVEKYAVLPQMYKVLEDFVTANNLKVMQPPILMLSPMPSDSVNVVAMLAVNKIVAKKNQVQSMKMPLNGRMLVGIFHGKYKDRTQLEVAMQQYCMDKNITSIVSSYEKFTNNKIPANDDAFVELEIHFPIL